MDAVERLIFDAAIKKLPDEYYSVGISIFLAKRDTFVCAHPQHRPMLYDAERQEWNPITPEYFNTQVGRV